LIAKIKEKVNFSKKNKLVISFVFLTNFPVSFHSVNIFLKKKNQFLIKQKFAKNFLIFLCLIKYFSKLILKNKFAGTNNSKSSLFTYVLKKKNLTLLRAPFRHKLSKKHLFLKRYKINYTMSLTYNNYNLKKPNMLAKQLTFFKKQLVWFESNICYQHSLKVKFTQKIKKSFLNIFF